MKLKMVLAVMATSLTILAASPARAEVGKTNIEAAITLTRNLPRPGRDNLTTVWDGDKYVQCRALSAGAFRCEAAGSLMQPSLAHVLTPERIGRLAAMGWMLDPSFGNYVKTYRFGFPSETIAEDILAALSKGYDADVQHLEMETTTIPSEPCPPRNGPSQNLAGMINDTPSMAAVAVHACRFEPAAHWSDAQLGPGSTAADLIKLYGPRLTAEFRRLRLNIHREVFVVFDTGLGYVQCQPQTEPDGFYCEAQSADTWPALAAVLTPDRIARLHAAGYSDPGRAPNYSKTYLAGDTGDDALASEILTLLHDVYGYYGASKLAVKTEEGG